MKPKINIDWKKAIFFLILVVCIYIIVAGGLALSHPLPITLAILLLLFAGDQVAANIDYWLGVRKRRKEEEKEKQSQK